MSLIFVDGVQLGCDCGSMWLRWADKRDSRAARWGDTFCPGCKRIRHVDEVMKVPEG